MNATDVVRYIVKGSTDDVTTCEVCGKPELKGTVILGFSDDSGLTYAGSACAAKLAGRPVREIRSETKEADRANREAERRAHSAANDARMAERYAGLGQWMADTFGIEGVEITSGDFSHLSEHRGVTGLSVVGILRRYQSETGI
jgi:hypothetical protein